MSTRQNSVVRGPNQSEQLAQAGLCAESWRHTASSAKRACANGLLKKPLKIAANMRHQPVTLLRGLHTLGNDVAVQTIAKGEYGVHQGPIVTSRSSRITT